MDCLLITRLIESLYKVVNLYEQVIQSEDDTDIIINFFYAKEECIDKFYNASCAIHSFIKTLEDEDFNLLLENEEKIELKLLNVEYNLAELCVLVSKAPAIEVDDINLSVSIDNKKYLEFSNKLLETKTESKDKNNK